VKLRHFYHVYAGGGWAEAVAEHAAALGQAGLSCPVTIGLVGPEEDRFRARERITERFYEWYLPEPDDWIEADAGFEQVTLAPLREYALRCEDEEAILYAHTKGAYSNEPLNTEWRRSMTRFTVGRWVQCVSLISGDNYDTAGSHWLTPEEHHKPPRFLVTTPMYGGNFWWARTDYLRKLPPPGNDYRHQAEEWLGLAGPRAYDFLPGWPSMKLCAPERAAPKRRKKAAR
jgi:hypothetical protein